ncbi:hypothetical protein VCHA39O220_180030 [Vibrio chagasii]|nr:hypothetical protein VCHA39O220_180030 [Vibrio chagasii]CAH7228899.1 hypothetical protein VCHA39O224_180030 [Vibrio chagasii]
MLFLWVEEMGCEMRDARCEMRDARCEMRDILNSEAEKARINAKHRGARFNL